MGREYAITQGFLKPEGRLLQEESKPSALGFGFGPDDLRETALRIANFARHMPGNRAVQALGVQGDRAQELSETNNERS